MLGALAILVDLGDTWGEAALTNNAGMALLLQGRPAEARPLFERAVALQREVGDPHMLANFLATWATPPASSVTVTRRCGATRRVLPWRASWVSAGSLAYLLEDAAMLAVLAGRATEALRLAAAGARLRQEIGAPLPPEGQRKLDERLEPARMALTPAQRDTALAGGIALTGEEAVHEALLFLDGEHQGWALSISPDHRRNPQEGIQA